MKLYLVRGVPRRLQQDSWWMDGDLAMVDTCPNEVPAPKPSAFSRLRQFISGR